MGSVLHPFHLRGDIGLERLTRHLLLFILIAIACYAGLVLFANWRKFWAALLLFPLSYVPLLLSLACLNYVLRYFRWQIYLKALGIRLDSWRSFQIFMAGLTMTITPGKAGEALKAHLLKREGEHPWSMGLPVVFAERLTDLMGLVVLVALGLKVLPVGGGVVVSGVAICVLLVVFSLQPAVFRTIVRLLGRLPAMARRSEALLEMHGNIKLLLTPRLIFVALLISCVAWFAECLVLYFVVSINQGPASWLQATFIYALSTLAGALSILPGGLVATEGSMTGLLLLFGLERTQGAMVTLVVRLCTLWFAVFLGMVFLLFLQREALRGRRFSAPERDFSMRATEGFHTRNSD